MKRFAYYIALLPLVALCACSHNDIDEIGGAMGNGNITIAASLDDLVITRAADTQAERTVEYIDVFAVDSGGNIDYHERNEMGNDSGSAEDGAGKLTLSAARRAKNGENYVFAQGEAYKFYLVANASASEETMAALTTLRELQLLVQDDTFETTIGSETKTETLLHLTGATSLNRDDIPSTFLMDAVAASGEETGFVVNPTEGNLSNLELTATFKRAAAKIIVNIKQGEDVEFQERMEEGTLGIAQYDFYKLPSQTFVLPDEGDIVGIKLVDTGTVNINNDTFKWDSDNNNQIQIIGYAYAHSWDNTNLTNETSLILNIPMMWNEDDSEDNSAEAAAPNSWYKVPLSQQKMFERNKCYVVNIEINAVGATNRSTAIELRDIEYKTLDWQQVGVDVGDSSDDPEFLVLNTDLLEMYNVNFDNSSLNFSSSSPITSVVLKDVYSQNADGTFTSATDNYSAYYVNKFGVKTNLNNTVRGTISASAEQGVLNGGISILSPIVPATPAEVEAQILEQLGPAPTAPTLARPTYDGNIPTEPTVVPEPTMPDPDAYVSNTTTSQWGSWSGWSSYTYNNGSENQSTIRTRTRTRTRTMTEYQYVENTDGTYTFQRRTGTQTQTRTGTSTRQSTSSRYWGSESTSDSNSDYVYTDWTTDTAAQNSWNNAMTTYNTNLAEYNQYLEDKAEYDADMEELNAKPEYKQYLIDLAAYESAWDAYNTLAEQYEDRADAIRAAAGGEETHYNTIRYLEFEVTNEQGLTATFRVMQYPTIYITNVQGSYSYRDDFINRDGEVVTYKLWQNKDTSYDNYTRCNYSDEDWTYNTGSGTSSLFCSKYVYSTSTSGTNQGKSEIRYYYWSSRTSPGDSSVWDGTGTDNARMYHVQVTATSETYTIGRPRMVDGNGNYTTDVENGYTDDSDENAKLVSPSFMLASQLGATQSPGTADEDMPAAADHCRYYVEVAQDGTEYHDWRLPTAAEIDIIIQLQKKEEAIDEVLAGESYWSANGVKETGVSGASGTGRIRCVRDAY